MSELTSLILAEFKFRFENKILTELSYLTSRHEIKIGIPTTRININGIIYIIIGIYDTTIRIVSPSPVPDIRSWSWSKIKIGHIVTYHDLASPTTKIEDIANNLITQLADLHLIKCR